MLAGLVKALAKIRSIEERLMVVLHWNTFLQAQSRRHCRKLADARCQPRRPKSFRSNSEGTYFICIQVCQAISCEKSRQIVPLRCRNDEAANSKDICIDGTQGREGDSSRVHQGSRTTIKSIGKRLLVGKAVVSN